MEDLTDIKKIDEEVPRKKSYQIVMILILALVHILDAVITYAGNNITTSVLKDLLVTPERDLNDAIALSNALGALAIVIMIFGFIMKNFMDKRGRKPAMIVSILGMSLSCIARAISPNYILYFISAMLGGYFVGADIQLTYATEEAKPNKRATLFSYIKVVGILGTLVIPWMRGLFIENNVLNWRPIFLIPGIAGFGLALLAYFGLKETKAYEYSKLHPELKKVQDENITFRKAVKRLRKSEMWPQLRWTMVAAFMGSFLAMGFTYNEPFMEQEGILEIDKNTIIVWNTLAMAVVWFLQGPVADKLGRKPGYIIWGTLTLVGLGLEIYAMRRYNLILAGLGQGMRVAAYWNMSDLGQFLAIESSPTHLRGNAIMLWGFALMGGILIGLPAASIMVGADVDFATILLVLAVPSVVLSNLVVQTKIKETKNLDVAVIKE